MPKKITIVDLKSTNHNEQTEETDTHQLAISDNNTVETIEEPPQ